MLPSARAASEWPAEVDNLRTMSECADRRLLRAPSFGRRVPVKTVVDASVMNVCRAKRGCGTETRCRSAFRCSIGCPSDRGVAGFEVRTTTFSLAQIVGCSDEGGRCFTCTIRRRWVSGTGSRSESDGGTVLGKAEENELCLRVFGPTLADPNKNRSQSRWVAVKGGRARSRLLCTWESS